MTLHLDPDWTQAGVWFWCRRQAALGGPGKKKGSAAHRVSTPAQQKATRMVMAPRIGVGRAPTRLESPPYGGATSLTKPVWIGSLAAVGARTSKRTAHTARRGAWVRMWGHRCGHFDPQHTQCTSLGWMDGWMDRSIDRSIDWSCSRSSVNDSNVADDDERTDTSGALKHTRSDLTAHTTTSGHGAGHGTDDDEEEHGCRCHRRQPVRGTGSAAAHPVRAFCVRLDDGMMVHLIKFTRL